MKSKLINAVFTLFFLLINVIFSPCFGQSQVVFSKINQTNGLSNDRVSSIVKEKNSFVWIGTFGWGLNKFYPETIKVKNVSPKVKFTSFKLFNNEVLVGEDEILKNDISIAKNITLKHDQDNITFEFASMLIPSSANCEYQIKMENLDQHWQSIGKEESATYDNLPSGNYVFKVRCRKLGSKWANEYSSLNITILKPFWFKWWAFLIYALLGILFFYVLTKYIISRKKRKVDFRLEKLSHQKNIELYNLKQDFFTPIANQIITPTTLILSSINKLFKNKALPENKEENPNITIKTTFNNEQTLLVVEDNIEMGNYIVKLLSDEFTVLRVFNAKEGLETAFKKLPDLVISAVKMPVMDGIELTRNLKSNTSTSHIPVILLTAQTSLINQMEGFESGADDYITKPFNDLLLRARIKSILKNRSLLHTKFHSEDTNHIGELVKNKKNQEFLENLDQFIEKNIESDNLSVILVAKELGMSHSVLYKKLKTITGLSLVEYIRDYRLKKAMQLLTTKQFTINEICYQVGYSNRKYFSKLFKERFGNPPTFYRKE